ncbi:hypothetical protein KFK09_021879 [Dendrobium nobile]|uniref:non-specific serine/threonine protein kinase n=1 Tax=Dendrobium nobile TaxID=94219 RepID=A0A8T3AHD9_DENNO|nr:hypothetical protein KFK09_021879 [Dendrobium nobile]
MLSPWSVRDSSYGGHSDGGSNSESSSSERSTSPDGSMFESHNSQWRSLISGLLLRKYMSTRRLFTFPPSSWGSASVRKNSENFRSCKELSRIELTQQEIPMNRPTWRNFDYQELVVATNNFSHENLIAKGGHAEVYKGCLPDGQLVAVKRLSKKGKEDERICYFLSELGIIAHVDHANAAQLLGFSIEGGLHMVLKFSPQGSLASILHGSKEDLKWKIRLNIALKIAEELCYLHEGCQRRIIHRDIKVSNILLSKDYQTQISDFGLAKWLPDKWTHHIVFPIEGTFGYMAPEYFMHGVVNEKTDVFAYGVLLPELIADRRVVDSSQKSPVIIWAKPFLDADDFNGLADPSFGDDLDPEELKLLISVASMCIHHISISKPNMNTVVQLLRGEVGT